MLMKLDVSTLYCKKCNKNSKNNNGIVGKEVSDQYPNKNTLFK